MSVNSWSNEFVESGFCFMSVPEMFPDPLKCLKCGNLQVSSRASTVDGRELRNPNNEVSVWWSCIRSHAKYRFSSVDQCWTHLLEFLVHFVDLLAVLFSRDCSTRTLSWIRPAAHHKTAVITFSSCRLRTVFTSFVNIRPMSCTSPVVVWKPFLVTLYNSIQKWVAFIP